MKDSTKKILAGAGVFAFAGLAATGGYFLAKMTDKNDSKDKATVTDASDEDAYNSDDEYYTDYDYSEMVRYISLGDYKGVSVTTFEPTLEDIDEETINDDMEYYLEDYKEYTEITDRAVKKGDTVVISCTATIDNKEIEDLAYDEYEAVLGEDMLFTELEDKLIGMKAGESTVAEITHPADFEFEEYAGKAATYNISLESAEECTYAPTLTDEFVKEKIDGCETIEDWKKVLINEELESLKQEAKEQLSNDVFQEVVKKSSFTDFDGLIKAYPSLYEDTREQIIAEYQSYAEMFGMDVEQYMSDFAGITDETIEEEIKNNIIGQIVLQAIIDKEGLEITEDDFNSFVDKNYEDYECESAEEFIEYYTREVIEEVCLQEKCYDFLIANARVTTVSYDEYIAMTEGDYNEDDYYEDDYDEDDYSSDSDASYTDAIMDNFDIEIDE